MFCYTTQCDDLLCYDILRYAMKSKVGLYSAGRVPSQQAVTAEGLCEQDYVIECVKAGLRARATCHRACRLRFDRISAVICAPRWVKRYLCTVRRSVSVLPVGPSCIIGATLIPPSYGFKPTPDYVFPESLDPAPMPAHNLCRARSGT